MKNPHKALESVPIHLLIILSVILISSFTWANEIDCSALNQEIKTLEKEMQAKLPEMQKKGNVPEDIQKKFDRYEQITHFAGTCGSEFPELYDHAHRICAMYSNNKPDEFEQHALPHCENALFNNDADDIYKNHILLDIIMFYMRVDNPNRSFKRAVYYLDKYAEHSPKGNEFKFFKAAILRRGGYGIEKDHKTTFEIIKKEAESGNAPRVKCELSLYYRNGIGTTIDENEADKWLAEYERDEPNKTCKYMDLSYFFGERGISKDELNDLIKKVDDEINMKKYQNMKE